MKGNLEIKLKNKWPFEWYKFFFWGNQMSLRERALKLEEVGQKTIHVTSGLRDIT